MASYLDLIGVGLPVTEIVLRVRRLPVAPGRHAATPVSKLPGGAIPNATCAAARLGLRAGFIGWVGDDAEAQAIREDFLRREVDPTGLVSMGGDPTPFTVILVDGEGRRASLYPAVPLGTEPLTYEQLNFARRARAVFTFPRDLQWCGQLRSVTLDSGGLLALDVPVSTPMRGADLVNVIHMAEVVFVTQDSLKALKLPSLRKLVDRHQWVIMEAGDKGAYGIEAGQRKPVFSPAPQMPVKDWSGADDCFRAALLAARLDRASLIEALAFANAAAALAAQHIGTRDGLPTRAAIEALLRQEGRAISR